MRERILNLLGVEAGEESMVTILLSQSVFLGIFFGTFDISAHAVFLSVFDERMMAKAYVVSGLAGIVLTSVYTMMQTRMSFRNFSAANLFAVTLMTLLLWGGLVATKSDWIVFLVFIMLGPLNILAALGFWGTAGRLFNLRQGKRLFGLVDSGLIAGIIISSYTIPVILSFNFASQNILLISSFALLAAALVQLMIGSRFSFNDQSGDTEKKKKESVISVLGKDRYITVMAVFVALSVMTAFFVQYSFMAVTRQQYPSEEDMARFLGIFTGSMMIFTLLIKLLAFSYLIRNYGLKITLTISPLLIALLASIAIVIGFVMGYSPAAASGFLIFFLILALGRLFSKSLKDSIESPSFKVIYQTIDEKIRFEVQSAMDGTVNEIAALTSGLILAGMGMLSFIKLIHFSIVLLILVLVWISFAFLLYREYRKSIRRALETESPEAGVIIPDGIKLKKRFSSELDFRHDYYSLITGDNKPLDRNRSRWYIESLIRKSTETRDLNLVPALKRISEDNNIEAELREKSLQALSEAGKETGTAGNEKIIAARKILYGSRVPQTAEILRLLRDNSVESKRYALYIIGKFRISEMLPEVCSCMSNPVLETDALSVLGSFGNEAEGELERQYMSLSGNRNTSASILRIISRLPSAESSAFLFSRLWSTSRKIRETAIAGLKEKKFSPSDEDRDRLHQLISEIAGLMTWNLSVKVCLKKHDETSLLEVFEKDNSRWRKFLFDLLSLAYDPGSISKIRENIEKDTVESGNFALEMIDIVIDDSIKPKIIALLDLVPDEDKLKNLWQFFPGEVPLIEKVREDIINRDYNLTCNWTKACTIHNISELDNANLVETVTALLFSPEPVLQEEASRLISRSDKDHYAAVSERIPHSFRKKTDTIIKGEYPEPAFIFEKVLFLSEIFPRIPEDELLVVAEVTSYVKDLQTGATSHTDCVVWNLDDSSASVQLNSAWEDRNLHAGRYYILSLHFIEEFCRHFPESAAGILDYIDLHEVQTS